MSELSKIAKEVLSKSAKFVNEQLQKPFQPLSVLVAVLGPERMACFRLSCGTAFPTCSN